MMSALILFDGVCNLCNRTVQFIINRDPAGYFRFGSLQSEQGRRWLSDYGVDQTTDSIVLIENGQSYIKSSAALRICRNLTGVWKLFVVFLVIPVPIRDFIYDFIAKNRYRWFGKREECMLPSSEIKDRFID